MRFLANMIGQRDILLFEYMKNAFFSIKD